MTLVLFGAVGLACSDILAVEDVVGIWDTTSINGDAVPGIVEIDTLSFDVEYWRWTFEPGGECTTATRIDSVDDTRGCAYQVFSQSKLVLINFGFAAAEGVVNGDRMAVTDSSGNVFQLQKQ
jgi:hypothetical protein